MATEGERRLLIRCVNERIVELAASALWEGADAELEFHCECGRGDCDARVCATSREFVRASADGPVFAPEHAPRAPASAQPLVPRIA